MVPTLLCAGFVTAGEPASVTQRRKFFQSAKQREYRRYTTDHVWTFHLWQEFLDYSSYVLSLYSTYDLIQHLDGQPLQVMIKDTATDKYMVDLEAWHINLVKSKAREQVEARR